MRGDDRSDEELLRSLVRDDSQAYATLFDRYSDFVYNVAFRRTASWSAAEDITEIVFMELWRQRHRVAVPYGTLRPWLAGVASNQSKRWWRDAARKNRAVERLAAVRSDEEEAAGDMAQAVASRIDDQRQMRQLLEALNELPPDQREVLALWAWEQLSYEEIAAALDIPIGTVRSRLNRARTRLRMEDGTGRASRASISRPPNGAAEVPDPDTDGGGRR